jgi:hypothetical protein
MAVTFRQISYARETEQHYYPMWRVDFEVDGKRQYRDVQAQNVIQAQQIMCAELGIPFRWH